MANLEVNVLVTTRGEVAAEENHKGINPGDTVTWVFNPKGRPFRVVFRERELPDRSRVEISEQGPFSEALSKASEGQISGTISLQVQDGLYFYEIFEGENGPLTWLNPIGNGRDFAGVEVPPPPPRP